VLLLTIIYTINLPVVRPRSCRVIYYFDTPALGRRHQSFGHVNRIMRIYDENIIKIAYYDQHRYDSSNPSDNKDETVRSLVETLDDDGGGGGGAFSSRIWLWY